MRKIKFKLLTQKNLEVLETAAIVFDELKADMANNPNLANISFSNNQLIERSTKVVYGTIGDAILPATDCIMFVTPIKTNSGTDFPSVDDLDEMGYNELRSLGSVWNRVHNAGIDLTGKRWEILERMEDYLDNLPEEEIEEEVQPLESLVEEALETVSVVKEILEEVKEGLMNYKTPEEELAVRVTLQELQEEAETLASLYKK